MSSSSCCDCETTEVRRLKVECNASVGRNLRVKKDATVDGTLTVVGDAILPLNRLSASLNEQEIPANVTTPLVWPTVVEDGLSLAESTSAFLVPRDGFYALAAQVNFITSTGNRGVRLFVNGVATHTFQNVAGGSLTGTSAVATIFLSIGQSVDVRVTQSSAGASPVSATWTIAQVR